MPLTTPVRVVRAHPEPRAETLPKYMARRGRTLYFKRKIPSDVADAFPQHAGQVWKSLATDLVSQARVLLAVEVTEFEMTVAQLRREKARQAVGGALSLMRDIGAPVPASPAVANQLGLVSGHVHSRPGSDLHEPLSARSIRDPNRPNSAKGQKKVSEQPPGELTGTRTRGSGGDRPVQTNTRDVAATCNVATFAPAGASRDRRPQLLHLFEDWRRTQTRPRTATLLTQVEVDPRDPAFGRPSKPVGSIYSEAEARRLATLRGWSIARDGDAWRRVVASPRPVRILELDVIRLLVDQSVTVICAGGGGIPVVQREDGAYIGVEAVIDKDHASGLLAAALKADALLMLTDVSAVFTGWGTPQQRALGDVTPQALVKLDFAAGSMGPKVQAVCDFVNRTGAMAGIGALQDASAILARQAGTRVVPSLPVP